MSCDLAEVVINTSNVFFFKLSVNKCFCFSFSFPIEMSSIYLFRLSSTVLNRSGKTGRPGFALDLKTFSLFAVKYDVS